MSKTYLFVYGTLKARPDGSSPMPSMIAGPHMAAVVRGYTLYLPKHRGYPMAVPDTTISDDRQIVQGEVVEISTFRTLNYLDGYEGVHAGLYRREMTEAQLESGETVTAYIYVATPEAIRRAEAVPIGSFWSREAFRLGAFADEGFK